MSGQHWLTKSSVSLAIANPGWNFVKSETADVELGASLDKLECIKWVGETYLAATAPTPSSAIGRSQFLRAWKDCLPESWRDKAALSELSDGSFLSPDPTTLHFVEVSQRQPSSKATAAASNTTAKAKPTRNWHELLKNQKRH